MQQGPWQKYQGQTAPIAPGAPLAAPGGVIYGRPKTPDPLEINRDLRDGARLDIQVGAENRTQERFERTEQREDRRDQKQATEKQFEVQKSLRTEFDGLPEIKRFNGVRAARQQIRTLASGPGTPQDDIALIISYMRMLDPASVVREGEFATAQNAASVPEAIRNQYNQVVDGSRLNPEQRSRILDTAERLYASERETYNSFADRYRQLGEAQGVNPDYVARRYVLDKDNPAFADRYNSEPAKPEGEFAWSDSLPEEIGKRLAPEDAAEIQRMAPYMTAEAMDQWFKDKGMPLKEGNAQSIWEAYQKGARGTPGIKYDEEANKERLRARAAATDAVGGERSDYGTMIAQGGSLGASDELAGIGGFIGSALRGENPVSGYREARDTERVRIEDARGRMGWAGTALEIGSGLIAPVGIAGNAIRGGSTAQRFASGARAAVAPSALAGFNYGEGADSIPNALLTAGVGAPIGGALNAFAPQIGRGIARLANSPNRQASRVDQGLITDNARNVIRAGQDENVPVSRAMLDPALENRVTGAQATLTGGAIVDRSLDRTARAIEGRVQSLGRDGQPLDNVVAGEKVTGAAMRFIKHSGERARRQYDRAEILADGVRITPTQSVAQVDDMIARLGETPNTNQAEINFLQSLKEDLSGDLSVRALRSIRTSLRKKIANGGLSFGEDEARVLGVMETASGDVERGLRAAGRGDAADAFKVADQAYRERMEFINGTIQKVIGRRQDNRPPEQVLARFRAMASPKGDSAGFARMMRTLEPDEQSDIAATFAQELGKNNKGEFSTAHLISQAEKLPNEARKVVFGEDGAVSVNNLIALAREHHRVTSKLNNSRSSVGVLARDYRQWLAGAVGVGSQIMETGAMGVAGAGALAGSALARDFSVARALMSKDVSRWLREAPRSANPRVIDGHFRKLGQIAARNPAIAQEVSVLQQRISQLALAEADQNQQRGE